MRTPRGALQDMRHGPHLASLLPFAPKGSLHFLAFLFALIASSIASASHGTQPEDFGARADGIQDDSIAVQAAIDFGSQQRRPVRFAPARTYSIGKTLRLRSNTVLLGADGQRPTLHAPQSAALRNMIVGERLEDVRLAHLAFVNDYIPPDHGAGSIVIFGRGTRRIRIEQCHFSSTPQGRDGLNGRYHLRGVAFEHEGISDVQIVHCEFSWLKFGVLTNSDADDQRSAADAGSIIQDNFQIVGNRFHHIAGDAIELNHPGARGLVRNFLVSENQIEVPPGIQAADSRVISAAGFGIGVAGAGKVLIERNHLRNCRWQGIHLEDFAHEITIRHNLIEGPGIGQAQGRASSANLIHILNSQSVLIEDCLLRHAAQTGIAIGPGGQSLSKDIVLRRTTVEHGGRIGIYSQSSSGNIIEDVVIRDFEVGAKIYLEKEGSTFKRVRIERSRTAGLETALPADSFGQLSEVSFHENKTDYRFASPQMLNGQQVR
jgi:hypothetical protein